MPIHSDRIWDPLRKKSVARTPEEEVRQWFISILHEGMKVPEHLMMSEVSLRVGSKDYRADIVVWDRSARPLAVVECKRPEVALSPAVLEQALRYNCVLDVRCILITNGVETRAFVRGSAEGETPGQAGGDAYAAGTGGSVMAGTDRPSAAVWTGLDHFPDYEEMLNL